MKITPIKTDDGSDSLYLEHLDEHYHSTKGAIQESAHIFINAGFLQTNRDPISILEIGMGTGLNVLLTILAARERQINVTYTTLEKYPLPQDITSNLNYSNLLGSDCHSVFLAIHESKWNAPIKIASEFTLNKIETDLLIWQPQAKFDLVYFDAFGPDKQPEMWQTVIYKKIFDSMNNNGVLITYSAKGDVRRGLQAAGFKVKRLQGPPGKKHITQAIKTNIKS